MNLENLGTAIRPIGLLLQSWTLKCLLREINFEKEIVNFENSSMNPSVFATSKCDFEVFFCEIE